MTLTDKNRKICFFNGISAFNKMKRGIGMSSVVKPRINCRKITIATTCKSADDTELYLGISRIKCTVCNIS